MKDTVVPDINQRIAARVRDLRAGRGLSLETLARQSGVSRSMISLIERGESSATAVVLEKLAVSLGVSLAALFEDRQAPASPWVLEGSIEVALGEARHRLDAGDCLAMPLAGPTAYRNPGRKAARYLVAITGDGHATRRRP